MSLHYRVKYLCHEIACSVRCGNLAEMWTLYNPDSWQAAAAILNKMYWLELLSLSSCINIWYCLKLLADLRRFSCKLKHFNKKLQKCFSLNKIKHLLRFFCIWLWAMDYGNLWQSPLTKNKGLDWITLSPSYLKSGCSSATHQCYHADCALA